MNNELQISPLEKSFSEGFKNMDDILDFIEVKMIEMCDTVDREARERMTPNLYTREFRALKGDLLTSLKHKTEHQFIISKGSCAVFTDGKGWEFMEAPFHGHTMPGTRRLLYIFEDIIWTTFHPVPDNTSIDDVRSLLIDERDNRFLNTKIENI